MTKSSIFYPFLKRSGGIGIAVSVAKADISTSIMEKENASTNKVVDVNTVRSTTMVEKMVLTPITAMDPSNAADTITILSENTYRKRASRLKICWLYS